MAQAYIHIYKATTNSPYISKGENLKVRFVAGKHYLCYAAGPGKIRVSGFFQTDKGFKGNKNPVGRFNFTFSKQVCQKYLEHYLTKPAQVKKAFK
jgi:hypothetical protein